MIVSHVGQIIDIIMKSVVMNLICTKLQVLEKVNDVKLIFENLGIKPNIL